ncbi:HPr family phosphocarrier protein [Cryobacterium suzukii]|uniref:Phosphocarrier protein HPr n=1 Tax=Cryobacterium suzukii TaxID=1259198 RepID=A0A4R9AGW1_9MICO|nr:HPr family phosphocarrier protein [Cryobacterium suzukii]TFD61475.1 HPr family phosphocarrier protein [Cryobacterium suzukii]
MTQRTVRVASEHGLHARPASLFTKAVTRSGIAVTVTKGDKTANAASILGVISLGVLCGEEVAIEASGEGAEVILDELVELLGRSD